MATVAAHRFFVVYQNPDLWDDYKSLPDREFGSVLQMALRFDQPVSFSVVDRPSLRVAYPEDERLLILKEREKSEPMVIVLAFPGHKEVEQFQRQFRPYQMSFMGALFNCQGLYADPPISGYDMPPFQHWCPGRTSPPLFAARPAAEELIRAGVLRSGLYEGWAERVSVVVVDLGLQRARFPGAVAEHGWAVDCRAPFTARSHHGSMVARNAIAFAPDVTLFDCPLLPDRIDGLEAFLSLAVAAYHKMLFAVLAWRSIEPDRSWVLVNAWGVYDRRLDQPPGSDSNYTSNPEHYFNKLVKRLTEIGVDIVFAAGNCGTFCPSTRCGPGDRGPGHSIHGANSLAEVLTAGAVRCDATWLGYSSQGPGQTALGAEKPDICAPSQFSEVNDASSSGSNAGTSAACGMAAGVVAGLRRRWSHVMVSPNELRQRLRQTAWLPLDHSDATRKYGCGIIDVAAAVQRLEQTYEAQQASRMVSSGLVSGAEKVCFAGAGERGPELGFGHF